MSSSVLLHFVKHSFTGINILMRKFTAAGPLSRKSERIMKSSVCNDYFNIRKFCVLCSVFEFLIILKIKSDCFPEQCQPTDRCHGDRFCFLWHKSCNFKYYLDELRASNKWHRKAQLSGHMWFYRKS